MADQEDELQKARRLGMDYLAGADRAAQQVRQKLHKAGFSGEVVEQVIAEFAEKRWLDDEGFARRWVESRLEKKPAGARRFAQELRGRGIEPEIVERVLGEFAGQLDAEGAMAGLLRRQQGRWAGLEEERARRRMLDFLRRRGYDEEGAVRAVEQVWKEMQQGENE